MEILEHVVQAALFNTRRCEVAIRMTTIGEGLQEDSVY